MAVMRLISVDSMLHLRGGVREWLNRAVSKTVVPYGYRGFESHPHRQPPCAIKSPSPREPPKNTSICAVHAPKLLTEPAAAELEFVSLRWAFSEAPDCTKTVRVLKPLILRGYMA